MFPYGSTVVWNVCLLYIYLFIYLLNYIKKQNYCIIYNQIIFRINSNVLNIWGKCFPIFPSEMLTKSKQKGSMWLWNCGLYNLICLKWFRRDSTTSALTGGWVANDDHPPKAPSLATQ